MSITTTPARPRLSLSDHHPGAVLTAWQVARVLSCHPRKLERLRLRRVQLTPELAAELIGPDRWRIVEGQA